MSKAKLIAVCGFSAAFATLCLVLTGLPGANWVSVPLAVMASVAVTVPMLVDRSKVGYSLLVYFVSGALGVLFGIANVTFVVAIVAFCMPFTIVKVHAESVKMVVQQNQPDTVIDPFDNGDTTRVVTLDVKPKTRWPLWLKWLVYFVLLEVAICLTLGATYLFAKPMFDVIVDNKYFWWVLVAGQLLLFPFDLLMRGCLTMTIKALRKAIK